MVDEARFVAAGDRVNAKTITELHQASEADRIIKPLASFHFSCRKRLSLILDDPPSPFDIFPSK